MLRDATLPHQLTLWFTPGKQECYARCNCGWTGLRRRPEVFGAIQGHLAEYEGHLVARCA